MEIFVLVPVDSEALFRQRNVPGLGPVFYRPGSETLFQRVIRKLGWRDIDETLALRLGVLGGLDFLDRIQAVWMSPSLYLPSALLERLLDRSTRLKWVYSQVTGTEHLDLGLFKERGVMVSNGAGLNSRGVAEMALACVFAHAKRLPMHLALQRQRQWKSLPADDLHRQVVGVIGTGNIGGEVASLCRAIGMRVVGASRDPKRFGHDPFPYHDVVPLDEDMDLLLAGADHVVLALPLNQRTQGLIGKSELGKMRRDASLINVARGALVNEVDLCVALSDGRIGAAYIERPTRLPPPPWSRLYRTKNLMFTHYSAANSPHLTKEAFEQFLAGLRCLEETGQPPARVA